VSTLDGEKEKKTGRIVSNDDVELGSKSTLVITTLVQSKKLTNAN
jgi:hypothetical protein